MTRVQLDRGLITHRTGGHKDRCFLLKNLRRAFLQMIDRRIFAIDVVADFGAGHRAAHRGRGFRYSVAA